ncbi:MAG TPA: CPBP family intramembrane glutamic endopeptidase, partial [Isosphaeraceae bacterium]|nr:CPBP family intramembrane glutamic endopeptidase [Isosphaeraceae bacterium]
MTLEDLFLVDGNLRPVWRFFLSVVLVSLAYAAAYLLAGEVRDLIPRAGAWYGSFFLFQLLAFLGSFKIMTRVFEQKPLGVVGLAFHPYWGKELCVGLGIGGIMIVSVGGAEALLALARYARNPLPAGVELAYGSGMFLLLFISATNEELVFRGYPFQKLVESLGPPGAVAVSSACFGLAHLGNSHHTWISTVNTMLVGVPLSIAYLRTRSLWMPVGIHFAWNYVQGFVFGLPVSGFTFPTTLLNARVHGGEWLTGSAYGPEGGLLCTIAALGAGTFLFLSPRIRMSGRMRELVYGPSPY